MDLVSEYWGQMALSGKAICSALVLLSIYSYAVMVDRGMALRWTRQRAAQFVAEVGGGGRDVDALLEKAHAAEKRGYAPLAFVVGAALDEYKQLVEEGQSGSVVMEGVDEAGARALDVAVVNLRQRLAGMATIAGVGPFLGLFGTVTGLIAAFRSIAQSGSGGLATVSGGIAEALVTTVLGLWVAIPALWAYNYFMNRIDVLSIELDNSATRLVTHAVRRALVRLD
ncbi:MAG: MotA/TolQ/ExbB proton channel family protein [Candidatus Latescibacterota bacterium]